MCAVLNSGTIPAASQVSAREPDRESFLKKRIASIDALRGFDMFWITGGEEIIHALHKMSPGPATDLLNVEFQHVSWAGFHFYDLIFPLFLFVVGLVLPFSLSKHLEEEGAGRGQVYRRIVRRLVVLFVLGLVYNGLLDFNFHHLRIAGVLQRIAICYFFSALIVMNTKVRGQVAFFAGILVAYWLIMKLVPVPGVGAGVITPDGNLASYIDRHLLPRPYCCFAQGDNEGILSTFPAIATTLLGVLAGQWLRTSHTPNRKTLGLALAGVASLLIGFLWSFNFPIIKNIWTSSFVLFAGGWSLLLLALFYWIIDVKGYRRWAFFFTVIGVNAITIYLASHLFDFGTITTIFVHGFINHLGAVQPLFWAVSVLMTQWLFLYFLYRQRIFLKV
jgi:predicted acyltransferase